MDRYVFQKEKGLTSKTLREEVVRRRDERRFASS